MLLGAPEPHLRLSVPRAANADGVGLPEHGAELVHCRRELGILLSHLVAGYSGFRLLALGDGGDAGD